MDIAIQPSSNYYNSYETNKVENNQPSSQLQSSTNKPTENELETHNQETQLNQKPFTELPKQEIIALYYDVQETQLKKDVIEAYAKGSQEIDYTNESVAVSLQDIHQLNKQLNRAEVLEDIASVPKDERNIDNEELLDELKENIKNPIANKEISQEEAVALYYNYQATQLTKDLINIYAQNSQETDYSSDSTEVSLDDINELQKQLNKGQVLDNIAAG